MNLFAFHQRRRGGATLAVVCLALLLCAPAQAARSARRTVRHRPATASQTKPIAPAVAPKATPVRTTPGMVVSIEPETGRLIMPTAEEMALLSVAEQTGLLRTSAGLTEVRLPDGTVMVDLQGRFMEFTVARLDREGRLHFRGVNEAPALLRLLDPCTPVPSPICEER
jgi:hypothetical protein